MWSPYFLLSIMSRSLSRYARLPVSLPFLGQAKKRDESGINFNPSRRELVEKDQIRHVRRGCHRLQPQLYSEHVSEKHKYLSAARIGQLHPSCRAQCWHPSSFPITSPFHFISSQSVKRKQCGIQSLDGWWLKEEERDSRAGLRVAKFQLQRCLDFSKHKAALLNTPGYPDIILEAYSSTLF